MVHKMVHGGMKRINDFLRNPKLVLCVMLPLVFLVVLNNSAVKDLKSLPSPLYGGDYYFELSQTQHFIDGGSLLDASNYIGALPHYFITYTLLAGLLAKIFSLTAIMAHFVLSYLIIIAAFIAFFLLLHKIVKNPAIAALSALFYIMSYASLPMIKYTNFAALVVMPLFLYTSILFLEKKNLKTSITLGIVYGIVGLTHNVAFIAATLFLAIFLAYILVSDLIKDKSSLKKNILFLALPVIIGVPIALLWWYNPIFVHMGQTANNFSDWTNPLWQSRQQFEFIFGTIKGNFFSFSSIRAIAWSLFNLLGILGLFIVKEKEKVRQVRLVVISSFIITMHYLITQPFFGFNLVPHYMDSLILLPSFALLFTLGVSVLYSFIHSNIPTNLWKKVFEYAFYAALIVLIVLVSLKTMSDIKSDKFYQSGKAEPPAHLTALRDYMEKNQVSVYDTIITTKELGFSLTAMTGRKLLTSRWGHTDPFFDLQDRELAEAIILYGGNIELKKDLLKKYDVKYLYWDYYWVQSEYYADDQGQVTGWFDPLMLFYSKEREDELINNNVSYLRQTTWPDPALKSDNFKQYDLMLISPQNYHNATHPWAIDLDPYLQEVWNYKQGDTDIARIYKVVNV